MRRLLPALSLAVAALLATLPLWLHTTLPRGDDVAQHVQFVRGFAEGWRDGWAFPRWLAAANLGYGAPAFVFYPPLSTALVAGIFTLGVPLFTSLRLGVLALTVTAAAGGAVLGACLGTPARSARERQIRTAAGAMVGSLLVLLPYHSVDLFNRFALAELATFVFLPLFFLALEDLRAPRRRLLLAATFAGLCFSHLPIAYLAAGFGGVWVLVRSRRDLVALALFLGLGAGCAAIYVVPAVAERADVHADWLESNPVYRFDQHWLFSRGRVDLSADPIHAPSRDYRHLPTVPAVRTSATVTLLLTLAAWGARRVWLMPAVRATDPLTRYGILAVGSTLVMTRLADPLWRWLPGLASVAFPWRLTTFLTLAAAVMIGDTCVRLAAAGWRRGAGVVALALPLALFASWQTARHADWQTFTIARAELPLVRYRVAGAFMPRASPIMRGFSRATPFASPELTTVTGASAGLVMPLVETGHLRRYRLQVPTGEALAFDAAVFDYPHWETRLDDTLIDHDTNPNLGTIRVPVPSGSHVVELRFRNTLLRTVAATLSLFCGTLLSCLTLFEVNRTMKGRQRTP